MDLVRNVSHITLLISESPIDKRAGTFIDFGDDLVTGNVDHGVSPQEKNAQL